MKTPTEINDAILDLKAFKASQPETREPEGEGVINTHKQVDAAIAALNDVFIATEDGHVQAARDTALAWKAGENPEAESPVNWFRKLNGITLALLLLGLLATGCATKKPSRDIEAFKSTTFGLDISTEGGSSVPHVKLGLVRYFYHRIPTYTNVAYAPPYLSDMTADIGLSHQTASERFAAGVTNFEYLSPAAGK